MTRLVELEPGDTLALGRLAEIAIEDGDHAELARLRDQQRAMTEAKERYRLLLRGDRADDTAEPARPAVAELARLARALGRQREARGWSLIRDHPKGPGPLPPLEDLAEAGEQSSGQTLAERFVDLRPPPGSGAALSPVAVVGGLHGTPQFEDRARPAGLAFVQDNGQTAEKLLPETMSGGVGLIDHDGDGWLDVYAIQGGSLTPSPGAPFGDRLYRNRGDGTFEDVSEKAGLGHLPPSYGHGIAVGDFDNDGHADLFLTRWKSYLLLHNRGDGTFEDVTRQTGLGGDRDWPTSAAWADLDGDGDLDLYVCHYLVFDPANPRICPEPRARVKHYCSPRDFPALGDHVFRNDHGQFVDVTTEAGFTETEGRGLGVVAVDLDDDNRVDIYVANDMSAN